MRRMLFLVLVVALPGLAAEEEVSRERLETIRERIGEVTDWLESARQNEDQHQAKLREAEKAISRVNRRLRELEDRVDTLDSRLARLRAEQQELEARVSEGRETLANLLRSAWMQGEHPALRLLLSRTDPQDVARLMTWHEYVGDHARQQLESLARSRSKLERNRENTRATRAELQNSRKSVRQRRDELAQRRRGREEALAALRSEISERKSALAKLREDRERLSELLREMEEAVSGLQAPDDVKPLASRRAKLPWPVRGSVIRRFGETVEGSDMNTNGIRIRTEQQAPVKAVHYGRVVFANWLRGFGLMIIIDHGDGFLSLYGNNGTLNRSAGEWVRAGETIALAGSSGGRSKPGLYFEIRRDGQPENPRAWLK